MGHSHHHPAAHGTPASFNQVFGLAVFLNAGFVIFQAIAALKAGSMGLLADAAHNAGDVFGLMLAWGANWLLTLPARERYSYGYRRTTMMAALANALILVAGTALIAWETLLKLLHPTPVSAGIVVWVALAGIVVNGGSALLFMRGAKADLNIKGAFLHLASDAAISLGVVLSGLLVILTGKTWIDPLTGLLIVVIILWSTTGLLRDSVSLILDAVPRYIDHQGVLHFFQELPGVSAVHDLHIWGLSTREVALTVHLVMPGKKLSDAELHEIHLTLKKTFRIDHATLQTESGALEFPCHVMGKC